MIYEPKGRAREYAELACNLAVGCIHGCRYCYGPGQFRVPRQDWTVPLPKQDWRRRFEKAAQKFAYDPREILFSFATDPLGTIEQVEDLRIALSISAAYGLHLTVLTKNPEAAAKFLPLFRAHDWRLGTTICFLSEDLRAEWEPDAPSISSRIIGLRAARSAGVRTWISVEPVVEPIEALRAIASSREVADEVRVGHWNHDARAKAIDWKEFHRHAAEILGDKPHLFKHDLLVAAGAPDGGVR